MIEKRDFVIWLIGFFEAEGGIITRKSPSGRLSFTVEIDQKDPRLLSMIAQRLGYGTTSRTTRKDGSVIWRYAAISTCQVDPHTHLLNGNLVTKRKRTQFRRWMARRRATGRFRRDPRVRRCHPAVSRLHAWWGGFAEGDAGFSIENLHVGRRKFVFTTKFYLSRMRAVPLLRAVLAFWKSDVKIQFKTNLNPHHRIEMTRLDTIKVLTNYFRRYPFRSQRRVMMARWRRFVDWKINGPPPVDSTNRRRLQLLAEHLNAGSGYGLRLKRFPKMEG